MEDYRVTQTGDEIQEIFNQSPVDTSDIAELKEAATSLDGRLESVEGKIPAGASEENPLTDKQYVDDSIASASATFRGTYNEVTDLELTTEATHADIGSALDEVIELADSNDYCFVQIPTDDETPTEIESIERYKFVTGTGWQYEYTLNNSGFTADQWAAINSGITSGLVAKLTDLPTNAELNTLLNGKANAADVYTKSETYNKTEMDAQLGAKANSADVYPKTDTYTKQEVNALITTPEVQYVTVTATAGTTSVTDVLPATGAANTIYRVGSWDGTQYDDGVYSEYSWNGSAYILLDVKNYGLATGSDFDNPTTAQRELVTTVGSVLDGISEGVFDLTAKTGDSYATLADALTAANTSIPTNKKRGGMSIKFVQSSDNKYMQYFYNNTSTAVADFTNVDNWEKIVCDSDIYGKNVANIESYGQIRNCSWGSSSTVVIANTPNGNYAVAFFPIENGKIYNLHVPNTRDGKVYGFCNEKIASAPASGTSTNLGGEMASDIASSGNVFDKKVQNTGNYQYLVVLFTYNNIPTLIEFKESDVVLYIPQTKTDTEKEIARQNIGAVSRSEFALLQEEQTAQANGIEKVGDKLDYNLAEGNIVPELAGSKVGIKCDWSKFEINANITTYYIKVYRGYKIKIIDNIRSGYFAFSTNIPARNIPTIDYQSVSAADLPNTVFTAGQDGYFACSYGNNAPMPVFAILADDGLRNYVDTKIATQKSTYIDPLIDDVNNLENELSTNPYIRVGSTNLNNQIPMGQGYATNNDMCTDYIFVKKNTHVKISGLENNCYCGLSSVVPAHNVSLVWYSSLSKSAAEAYDFIFDEDGYLGISRAKTATAILFDVQNKGIGATVNELVDNDATIYLPKYIYCVLNAGDTYRNVIQDIRLEGLADRKVNGFKVNGGRELPIYIPLTQSDNKVKIDHNIDTTSNGISIKNGVFKKVITKNSIIAGKTIKHLGIGDSWAAANMNQLNGEHKGSWNYLSEAVNEFMRTEIDLEDDTAKYISMGRVANPRRNGEYKGETYMIRASNEGRGGWAACSFLRFPFSIRTSGSGTMSEKLAWDALGLGRKQVYGSTYDESAPYTSYVADTAHRVQYLTEVAMGYYHWDYSTELLRWAEGSGSQSVYVAGNTTQQQTIDTAMEAALNNPENPFYDWATAISSEGDHAFSLGKYLERYKTLADDGVTRLVIGETAGTEITQAYQLEDYDICKPSHVTIELGMNDFNGLTAQQKANDVIALANVIHAYDSNIKIGIITVHYNGALYSGYFTDRIASNDLADTEINGCYTSVNGLRAMNTLLSEAYPSEDGTNNVYYIPSYFIQGCTRAGARIAVNADGREIINDGNDYIHPAIDVYKEMGQQLWAWLLYTL